VIAGRFELLEPLGGSSWRATDTELERDVLVRLGKVGSTDVTPLSHPSIARVFDQGEADGEQYVVREYLPGGSLAERGASSLSEREAHTAARDVAAALAYAHEQGVAHGALSEANVLLDAEGRAKVADFAGVGEPPDDVRAFGAILQTLATVAPALAPVAAAALGGELDSTGLVARLEDLVAPVPAELEPTTLVVRPPRTSAPPARRRSVVAAIALVAALLVAGIGAAFLATAGDSETNEPTTKAPAASMPTESTVSEPDTPPPATTADTTEATTTGTTTARTTTAPTTTAPPPATTTAPPPTTEPPSTTEPPPETTEPPPDTTEPPPTTTEEPPPPTTTEATTTETG
jgi:eukaryotic-like serine/threonine-protein kinase